MYPKRGTSFFFELVNVRKFNDVITLRLGRKAHTLVRENDVNVSLPLSSNSAASQECVSHDVSTFSSNPPLSKDVEESTKDKPSGTIDSTPLRYRCYFFTNGFQAYSPIS